MTPSQALSLKEQLETLQGVTIFSGFSTDNLRYICNNCPVLDAPEGEMIIKEGTEASEIMILLRGRVSIVLNMSEEPLELMEFGVGSCIGEASVIGIQSHSASAVVLENAVLMVLHRKVLMDLFDNNKSLFSLLILNIARELARRLQRTDSILLHYGKINKAHEVLHPGQINKIKEQWRS